MCLYTRQIMPRRATKDIVVYKVLTNVSSTPHVSYMTPYLRMPVKLNCNLKALGYSWPDKQRECPGYYTIRKGYIHCFLSIKDAIENMWPYDEMIKVVEAYIKKGTLYYISANHTQICAREVFITDKIANQRDEQML